MTSAEGEPDRTYTLWSRREIGTRDELFADCIDNDLCSEKPFAQ